MQLSSLFPAPPPLPEIEPDMSVGFILSPRFTILPFAGFVDSLRHAADEADHSRQIFCRWKIVAPKIAPIISSCGIEVMPQEVFPDVSEFDYLVVVGGLLPWCLDHSVETLAYIREAYERNVSIVGLCTGSFVMAQAGIMAGRKCAVHIMHRRQMNDLFPEVEPVADQIYVDDKGLTTCPGGTAAIDLAFHLIEANCGKARAIKGLTSLLVDKHRAAHHLPHRPHGHLSVCGNWKVEKAFELMERHITSPYSITKLANQLGCSVRELNRSFAKHAGVNPTTVWRDLRLAHCRWLLLNSSRTVTQIAMESGFSDSAHLTRWFKRVNGDAPKEFRKRHRPTSGEARDETSGYVQRVSV